MTKVLAMHFKNGSGKEITIQVNDPRTDLTKAGVEAVMQSIITKNIFSTASGDLVQIVGAQIKSTDAVDLA